MPRPDVKAIAADVARDAARARAALEESPEVAKDRRADRITALEQRLLSSVQYSRTLEGRLLASAVCDPAVLACCTEVGVEDFFVPAHRAIWTALRNLQAAGRWTSDPGDARDWVGLMADELDRLDARDEKHVRDRVDDLFLAELLVRHMYETYGPPGAPIAAWVEHDARKLRELAEGRRAL